MRMKKKNQNHHFIVTPNAKSQMNASLYCKYNYYFISCAFVARTIPCSTAVEKTIKLPVNISTPCVAFWWTFAWNLLYGALRICDMMHCRGVAITCHIIVRRNKATITTREEFHLCVCSGNATFRQNEPNFKLKCHSAFPFSVCCILHGHTSSQWKHIHRYTYIAWMAWLRSLYTHSTYTQENCF